MNNPIAYPFVRYATFSPLGPSIGSLFLNQTEDALGDLYGALLGRSAMLVCDEFLEPSFAPGAFGKLRVITNTNGVFSCALAPSAGPDPGLGVWSALPVRAATAFHFQAADPQLDQSTRDFLFSARVMIVRRSILESVANSGFSVGIVSGAEVVAIRCGSGSFFWNVVAGATTVATQATVTDGAWVDLQLCRISGVVTAYINGALVATVNYATGFPQAQRHLRCRSPQADAGEGYFIDYFKTLYLR